MTKTMVGARRALSPIRVRRPALRIMRQPEVAAVGHEQSAAMMCDEFGQRLRLLGCMLTDDADLAQMLVIQTIVAHVPEPCTIQDLSAGVYAAWMAWGNPPLATHSVLPPASTASERLMHEIRRLPEDQRAALGLCKYGGHTYRRAAQILGLAPDHVAWLLCDALRSLGPLPAA